MNENVKPQLYTPVGPDDADQVANDRTFEVESHGAYLTKLEDATGLPILAPIMTLPDTGKKRGGCHVCLPYFGADVTGRPQHGFGRDLEWRLEETDEKTATYFETDVPGWEGFRAQLEYASEERMFTMKLTIFNGGVEARRVSPGFHPYFAVSSATVELDGETVSVNEYGEARFIEGSTHTLTTPSHQLTLHSEELQTWAIWSDRMGDYFCVEPTFRGPSHAAGTEPLDGELIAPGEERLYTFTISW